MKHSRRDLLKYAMGAAAACTAGPALQSVFSFADESAKKIPIGVQLYSVRDVAPKDVPGTLEAVAKMGYQGVECAGYYGLSAEDFRKQLDKAGLKCCGTHTTLPTLQGDALKQTIEFNKIIGNKFLIIPSLPHENMASVAALIDTAKMLTEIADKAKESDMRVGYHAHAQDFKPLADRIPWEVLFSNAGPDVVMQLDTGNCMGGSGNPVAMLKKFPHRSATVHLKEHGGPKGAAVGEGQVPWKEVFQLCETTGDTEWYIVEQEEYHGSSMEGIEACIANLRKMGK